jgi:tRNA(Ile)-lysidine synthase
MSEEIDPSLKFGPYRDEVEELLRNTFSRLYLAGLLANHIQLVPEEGFFSWTEVENFARSVLPDTSYGGSIYAGALNSKGNEASAFRSENPLMVGVSGGIDSSFLLHLCIFVGLEKNSDAFSSLICCHINHKLRGEESDQDEDFCANLSSKMDIRFVSTRADEAQAQAFKERSGENALRDFRYSSFEHHASEVGSKVVALAHTLSDQVETLMFRMFRGTAAAGLRGIPCLRRHNKILIARPIIDVSREQILKLMNLLNLEWREDSSNAQLHYARNFIRAEIVPRIESTFPDFGSRIENMRQLIVDDEELLKALCLSQISEVESKNANSWQMDKLSPLSTALKRRMFAQALRSRGIEVSFDRVEKLVVMTQSHNENDLDFSVPGKQAISLNERWDVVKGKDVLMFVDKEEKAKANAVVFGDPLPVQIPGMTIVPALNKVLFVEQLEGSERKPKKFPSEDTCEAIVCLDKVKGPIMFRERQAGDCIQPFGMQELVKLKKYLHTHKPSEEETQDGKRTFVLACGDEILWVPGVGISEKLRVTGLATHVLKLLDIGISDSTFC